MSGLVGVLAQDLLDTGDRVAGATPLAFFFDLADQSGDLVLVVLRREVAKRRQRREADQVAGGVVIGSVVEPAISGSPFPGPVEPVPFDTGCRALVFLKLASNRL
jgi:hypothetical protein